MNKIFSLTLALTLLLSVSSYPDWGMTPAQEEEVKKMMTVVQKESTAKTCLKGWHKMSTWSLDQWGFDSGCVRNDANCANFDMLNGHCKKCHVFTKMASTADSPTGTWCYVTWYAWLFFYGMLFFGIAILICTMIACKQCCAQNKKWKKAKNVELEDCHVEMVYQVDRSHDDSSDDHVRYSNPYQH
jgi:hypothetical protein